MKHLAMTSVLALCAAAALVIAAERPAAAQDGTGGRPFGAGLMLGEPTGITAKWYLGKPFALQFGLGWVDDDFDRGDDDGLHIHVDAVWHPVVLTRNATFTLPFYVGVGGRILNDEDLYDCGGGNTCVDDDTYVGVRVPFGLLMDFNKTPIDIFLEIAVVVDLIYIDYDDVNDRDHDRAHLNGAIGARYYF